MLQSDGPSMWPAVKVMGLNRDNAVNQPPKSPTVRKSQSQQDQKFEERLRIAEHIVRVLREAGYCELGDGPARACISRRTQVWAGPKICAVQFSARERLRILSRHQMSGPPRRVRPLLTWRPAAPPVVSDGADRNAGMVPINENLCACGSAGSSYRSRIYFFSSRHFLPNSLSWQITLGVLACTQRSPPSGPREGFAPRFLRAVFMVRFSA